MMNDMSGHAFCEAAWNGDVERIQRLLTAPSSVDPCHMVDNRGFTPMHYAASMGNMQIMAAFLTSGENALRRLEARDQQYGNTPLLQAVCDGQEEMAQSLVEFGADVNAQNYAGESALLLAARDGNASFVNFLLENGADPRLMELDGATPLHMAVASDALPVVLELLNHGAPINAGDNEGDTPLHWCVREGHEDVLKLLVRRGADIFAKNEDGETSFDLAVTLNEVRIAQLLAQQESLFAALAGGQRLVERQTMQFERYDAYVVPHESAMDIDMKTTNTGKHFAAAAVPAVPVFGQAVF